VLISREDVSVIEGRIGKMLSGWKSVGAAPVLEARCYHEISAEMHRHVKSIDNALQRVKRKLQRMLQQ
jgi:RNA polymerase sporulation-specific sigma factor